jgi:hypothetical protein
MIEIQLISSVGYQWLLSAETAALSGASNTRYHLQWLSEPKVQNSDNQLYLPSAPERHGVCSSQSVQSKTSYQYWVHHVAVRIQTRKLPNCCRFMDL